MTITTIGHAPMGLGMMVYKVTCERINMVNSIQGIVVLQSSENLAGMGNLYY